jgi:hypothetical protein
MLARGKHILRILELVNKKKIMLKEAAAVLGISYRQMARIYKSYKQAGYYRITHGLRGKRSNRRIAEELRKEILCYYRENLKSFGPTTAAKKLGSLGYAVNRETLRKWLLEEGLWQSRKKQKAGQKRKRRHVHFGEMLFMGSLRDKWLGPKTKECFLIYLMDDATNITLCLMAEKETIKTAMGLLCKWVKKYGIPMSLCCNSRYLFYPEYKEEHKLKSTGRKHGKEKKTAFCRACDKLGIETIIENSISAIKYLQDHLINYKEKIRQKITTRNINRIENANNLLDDQFMAGLNRESLESLNNFQDLHVCLGAGDILGSFLCFEHKKILTPELVIQHKGKVFHIMDKTLARPWPYTQVLLTEWLDGSIHVYYGKKELQIVEVNDKTEKCEKF